jgi:hypothetical protein
MLTQLSEQLSTGSSCRFKATHPRYPAIAHQEPSGAESSI